MKSFIANAIVAGLMLSGVAVKSEVICEPLVTPGSVLITQASSANGEFRVYDPAGGECTYRGNVVLGYFPAGIEIGQSQCLLGSSQARHCLDKYILPLRDRKPEIRHLLNLPE